MKFFSIFLFAVGCNMLSAKAQSVTSITYPYSTSTGVVKEDMSGGTTLIIGPGADIGNGVLQNIGFDFWFGSVRYTSYGVSENGFLRLGSLIASPGTISDNGNNLSTFTQSPCIAPYWDDLRTGITGKVHVKVIGIAPNRKLVIEWYDMVPKFQNTIPFTFQLWLFETSGKIEFIYGDGAVGIPINNSQYSIGINRTGTSNAGIFPIDHSISYTVNSTANDNTTAIEAGRKYSFTPNIAAVPTNLNFSAVSGTTMTLNWADNATGELGYVLYRSDDGGNSYQFISQVAANTITSAQTGMVPGINYYWRVYTVTNGALSAALTGNQVTVNPTSFSSNGSGGGDWNNPATWAGGLIPTDADNVTIAAGDLVSINVDASSYNLSVAGVLQFESAESRVLDVFNNLTIQNSGVFKTTGIGVISHGLTINGNLTNLGTLDFFDGATQAGIVFKGNANSLFSGNGIVTDVGIITTRKISRTNIIELNLANFSVKGLTLNATAGFWNSFGGTLKISGNNSFSGPLTITPNGVITNISGLWMNNPNAVILGQAGLLSVQGDLRVTEGILNIGTTNANDLIAGGGSPTITIEGGSLNIASKCSTSNVIYVQTGGTVNVCTVCNSRSEYTFAMNAKSFTMSGGIIRLVQTNSNANISVRNDYTAFATDINITGGKLILGQAGVTTPIGGFVTYRMYGMTPPLELSEGIPELNLQVIADINTYGNITIPANASISMLNVGTGFLRINNGTITNNGKMICLSKGLVFTGTGATCGYKGSGEAGTLQFPFFGIYVDHATGLVIDPGTTNNLVVSNFYLQSGTVVNANKLTIGNGSLNHAQITIGSASGIVAPGDFDVPPIFSASPLNLSYLGPAFSRSMGKEVKPTRMINNLIINNGGATVTMAGGNLIVANALTLAGGKINLNNDTLTLGTSPLSVGNLIVGSNTSYLYNGKYKRWVSTINTGTGLIPIGTAAVRKPANINFNVFPVTGGTVTTEFVTTSGGTLGLPLTEGALPIISTSDEGYWRINPGDGLAGGSYTLYITASSITAVSDFTQLVMVKRTTNASPWILDGTHVTTTGSNSEPTLSRTGMSGFGEFGIGLPNVAIPPITSWTGAVSNVWENAANWSNGIPGATTAVTISVGKPRYPTINTSTSVKSISVEPGTSVSLAIDVQLLINGK